MKRWTILAILLLSSNVFAAVHVRGYVRKDGTYVPPYFRSSPDGNPWNNWSTYGNVNPYTGKEGSVIPHSSGGNRVRSGLAVPNQLMAPVASVDQQASAPTPLSSSAYDEKIRRDVASRLAALGESVDWQSHSFSEMYDMEIRIKKATDLTRLGYKVDWHQNTFSQMYDTEIRIKKSRDLATLGKHVDWSQYSFSQLYDMERQLRSK